jgi:hypothetical protein
MKKPEYYFCYIGPTDRIKLDKNLAAAGHNGESRLRWDISESFKRVTGHDAKVCGSGWGVTEKQTYHIGFATYNDELKKAVVSSYIQENKTKTMPDYIRAWYLLLKERKEIE